jgi:glutaconyl-CoA/methylmalonyl-CoA decarboxylase subunit gamma
MKLILTLHDGAKTHESELEVSSLPASREKKGRLEIQSPGALIEADWAEVAPQVYSILLNGRSFDVRLERDRGDRGAAGTVYTAHVGARVYQLELRDPRRARKSGPAGAHDGPIEIFAPMPGRIVKVLAAAGAEVKTGDSLMVIEAMKMQNEIRAPRAGRVELIRVAEGEGVESGAPLLRLA